MLSGTALLVVVLGATPTTEDPLATQADRFAILIGSNQAGPGQENLRYATQDAARMQRVLSELGGFQPERITLLTDPNPNTIRTALQSVARRIRTSQAGGSDSILLFYYSGHARAKGLNLGQDELTLDDLRADLEAVPATVRIVILDACQSGAFSNIKGVQPAGSFTVSSTERLDTQGSVVIASSSAVELSQEAESLQASIFSHHLTTALRGAADRNRDGRIGLDEAYEYAYRRTLVTSAATQIGRQHATLETTLKGKGDLILTQPGRAGSRLEFPEGLAGVMLVEHEKSGTVFAEVDKVSDDTVTLALPPGPYRVSVRRADELLDCRLALASQESLLLALDDCTEATVGLGAEKGVTAGPWWKGLSLEASTSIRTSVDDDYIQRIRDSGFSDDLELGFYLSVAISAAIPIGRYVEPGLRFQVFEHRTTRRSLQVSAQPTVEEIFEWSTYGTGAFVRFRLPLFFEFLTPYAHLGAGVSFGSTSLEDVSERFASYYLEGHAGLRVMFGRHVGLFTEVGYVNAPLLKNLLDDRHDVGGIRYAFGVRVGL